MDITYSPEERCVMYGEVIEEGVQVCARSKMQILEPESTPAKQEKNPAGKLWESLHRMLQGRR